MFFFQKLEFIYPNICFSSVNWTNFSHYGKFRKILDTTKLNKTIIWIFISSYKVQCVVQLLPFFSFLFGDPICKLEYLLHVKIFKKFLPFLSVFLCMELKINLTNSMNSILICEMQMNFVWNFHFQLLKIISKDN
jgi:hypothetical protein